MNSISKTAVPKVDGLTMVVESDSRLALRGTIATREPNQNIGMFFQKLHAEIVAAKVTAFSVDVSELTFVNSSAIRLFIDWAMWLNQMPASERYRLTFITSRTITWQTTNFSALRSLVGNVVYVEPKEGASG